MKEIFSTSKKVEKIVTEQFSIEKLSNTLNSKPREIFNGQWSSIKPFVIITEYNTDGFMFYCNGWADKNPIQSNPADLHKFLKFQGLEDCYVEFDIQCSTDEQQCRDSCKHQGRREECPMTTRRYKTAGAKPTLA